MRWLIKLQEYHLQITHISGKDNIGADSLTRYPQEAGDGGLTTYQEVCINQLMLDPYSRLLTRQFHNIHHLQYQDEYLQTIVQRITNRSENRY